MNTIKIINFLIIITLLGCYNNEGHKAKAKSLNNTISIQVRVPPNSKLKIINPTGTYSLENKTEERDGKVYGYTGDIQVKRIQKNQIVITFSICKGAPSYNLGMFVDTLKYVDNKAVYKGCNDTPNCNIELAFSKEGVDVTDSLGNDCGFGHGVYANGFFKKISSIEPILEYPGNSQRIETNKDIYAELAKENGNKSKVIPEIYNALFDVKLVGLQMEKKGLSRSFSISFSAACMCEESSILIQRKNKKIYVFPYCKLAPSSKEFGNYEYDITAIRHINNKLVVSGTSSNLNGEKIAFIFGKMDVENVFSLEFSDDKPERMWLGKYITNKKGEFKECECNEYD